MTSYYDANGFKADDLKELLPMVIFKKFELLFLYTLLKLLFSILLITLEFVF